jgi:heme-degrading monooxygenase HmoA
VPDELSVPDDHCAHPAPGIHVVVSELAIAPSASASLEAAFGDRLGDVDTFPGHRRLEVWKDDRRPGRYLMVTWWDTPAAFHQYLRSDAHRASHARIPTEPARPRGVRVDRFTRLAT